MSQSVELGFDKVAYRAGIVRDRELQWEPCRKVGSHDFVVETPDDMDHPTLKCRRCKYAWYVDDE